MVEGGVTMTQESLGRVPVWLVLVWVAAAGACGSAGVADVVARDVARADERAAVAVQLDAFYTDLGSGRPAAGAARLDAVWPIRDALADDRLLRDALGALPPHTLSGRLAESRRVLDGQRLLEHGQTTDAERLLAPLVGVPWDRRSVTAARARITHALASHGADPVAARQRLIAVANEPPPGPVGDTLGHLARLTVAGLDLDGGALKAAIAEYLRVPAESGYYRAARFGLATCQLEAGRHERALKILALLPGGLVGDPERAVMGAMAAHALGHTDAAVAVVDGALARVAAWDGAGATPDAVLTDVAGAAPRSEGLTETLAATPVVRRLGRELLATRQAVEGGGPYVAALIRYGERLEAAFAAVVRSEVAHHAERISAARGNLRALRPQLAPQPGQAR